MILLFLIRRREHWEYSVFVFIFAVNFSIFSL